MVGKAQSNLAARAVGEALKKLSQAVVDSGWTPSDGDSRYTEVPSELMDALSTALQEQSDG